MLGAIELMMAWRDFCKKSPACQECPAFKNCLAPARMQDGDIKKLISIVMAWKKATGGIKWVEGICRSAGSVKSLV